MLPDLVSLFVLVLSGYLPFGYLADLKSDRSLVGLLKGLCWSLDDEAVVRIGNCNCFRYLVTYLWVERTANLAFSWGRQNIKIQIMLN